MRLAAAIALGLVVGLVAPVEAHCFKVWRFPFPQRCGVSHMHRFVKATAVPVHSAVEPSPGSPLVSIPLPDADVDRAKGIAMLKALQK